MSFSGDMNSKYELTNFRAPNAGQKKLKRAMVIGGGVLAVWIGTIGVVAAKRFQAVEPKPVAAQAPARDSVAAKAAPAPVSQTVAAAMPAAVPEAAKPVNSQDAVKSSPPSATSKKAAHASSRSRRHGSSKRYAATTAPSKSSAAVATPSRMKDDQLDALLKQFK